MKTRLLVILSLVFLNLGCSALQKSPVNTSGNPLQSSNSTQAKADSDFALLEEEVAEQMIDVPDPLEGLNRLTFGLNDTLYFWVVKSVSETYEKIIPDPARIGIRNFFQNLTTGVRFVNCHLQGKTQAADTELKRFLINTTLGVLGFGDPAKDRHKLQPVKEDLGQTLAVWGLKDGFYLILPLLGPSSARDSAGIIGDLLLNPLLYVEPAEAAASISAAKFINESSFHLGEYEDFKQAAVDPYIAMRQAYIQYRTGQIEE